MKQGRFYEPGELKQPENWNIAALTTQVLLDNERLHRCVLCRAEQPHDVRWPRYAMELRRPDGSGPGDIEYTCCKKCESRLDAILRLADD